MVTLVKAVQEQQAEIERLTNINKYLAVKLETLLKRVEMLEKGK